MIDLVIASAFTLLLFFLFIFWTTPDPGEPGGMI